MTEAEVLDAIAKARALPVPTSRWDNDPYPPNDAVCIYLLSTLVAIEVHTGLRPHRVSPSVTTTEIAAYFFGVDGRYAWVYSDNDNDEGQGDTPDVGVLLSARDLQPQVKAVTLTDSFDGEVWRWMAAFLRGEDESTQAGEGSGE
jgi:hypothetical protein